MVPAAKKHPPFVTERLRLRPFRAGDLKVMHALYSDADNLRAHKVEAQIQPDDKPSIGLPRRFGFRLEGGPIRDRWFVCGRWHSVRLCGLITGEER